MTLVNVEITHACGHVVTYGKRTPTQDLQWIALQQWREKETQLVCKDCLREIKAVLKVTRDSNAR